MKNANSRKTITLAIIGGGLTGTSMLAQFVGHMQACLRQGKRVSGAIDVHVIEREGLLGPGFPHSSQNAMPFHLINMCARDMSILSHEPEDFQNWVVRRMVELEKSFPGLSDNKQSPDPHCQHYPRAVMGEYLKDRFQRAVFEAEQMGIRVHLHPGCEATDMRETADGRVRISAMDCKSRATVALFADRVLLATGHWFGQEKQDGYFSTPWPPANLQANIPEGADAAIIGASLSAIDAVLTLSANGNFLRSPSGDLQYKPVGKPRCLFLYSRRARLPTVRGRIGPYKNRFLVSEKIRSLIQQRGHLKLNDLFELLDNDLTRAYGRAFPWKDVISPHGTAKSLLERHMWDARYGDGPHGDVIWQTVLQQIFPMVRELYLALSPHDRMRLNRDFNTLFFIYAAPMPMINAEKLLALMNADGVVIRKLTGNVPFKTKGKSFSFTFQDPSGKTSEAIHPYVVDARGQSPSYGSNQQALAVSILKSGTAEIEPLEQDEKGPMSSSGRPRTGGLWIDPRTHRVRRTHPDGTIVTSDRIAAVGAMTRGQIIDASMAYGSAVSTQTVARDWVDYVFS